MKKSLISGLLILVSFCVKAQERVNFNEKFKKENEGKYKIVIHEARELLQIMIAITNVGKENDDMVQQQRQYYKDVLSYFKPYEQEPIIKTFDSLLTASLYNYVFLTGNAISYEFKGNKMKKNDVFILPAMGVANATTKVNTVTTYLEAIEKFAKKSKFRKFYKAHQQYYNGIIADYEKNANLGKQWKWLEKNFETKINSYIIFCSPLVNGLNYTGEYNNNNFRLIHMNLPPLDSLPKLTAIENELFNTRVMFTEIDHNYVSAPTKAHAADINRLFKDRSVWTNEKVYGISAYPNPLKVFDEYMTYGVFLLFCKDNYDDSTFSKVRGEVIQLMTMRGFPKMKDFTDKLIKIYTENPGKKIDGWYGEFLKQFED